MLNEHPNDPHGVHATSRRASAALAELDRKAEARAREMPGLIDRRELATAAKKEAAVRLRLLDIGRDPDVELTTEDFDATHRDHPMPVTRHTAPTDAERAPYVSRLVAASQELDAVNRLIAAHRDGMSDGDRREHVAELTRRATMGR